MFNLFSEKPSNRQVHHIRVGSDEHGKYPSQKDLDAIKLQFETAAAKVNSTDAYVVTTDKVDVQTLYTQ